MPLKSCSAALGFGRREMKIHVEFDVEIPEEDCSEKDIEEWVRYELHDNGRMCTANPLYGNEAVPVDGTFRIA